MKSTTTTAMVHHITLKDRNGRVIGEKDVVSYAGLLDLAHKERLESVDTAFVQLPSKENNFAAIVRATVKTSRGTYSAIGDASPQNVAPQIAAHFIRMAETRAIARALRTAVNIGTVAIEELGDDFDARATVANDNAVAPPVTDIAAAPRPSGQNGSSSRATDQQRRYIYRLLQKRGIEGERAREFVQRELGVATVKDAPKMAVSALIDRLVSNGNGTANGASNGGAA